MKIRRATVLAATALTTVALTAGATPAVAQDCVSYSDGVLDGTVICFATGPVAVYTRNVPVYVGPVCVDTTCTAGRTVYVPVPTGVSDPVDVWGTICVTLSKIRTCRPFQDDQNIGSLQF